MRKAVRNILDKIGFSPLILYQRYVIAFFASEDNFFDEEACKTSCRECLSVLDDGFLFLDNFSFLSKKEKIENIQKILEEGNIYFSLINLFRVAILNKREEQLRDMISGILRVLEKKVFIIDFFYANEQFSGYLRKIQEMLGTMKSFSYISSQRRTCLLAGFQVFFEDTFIDASLASVFDRFLEK